jgi:hypothetical protein
VAGPILLILKLATALIAVLTVDWLLEVSGSVTPAAGLIDAVLEIVPRDEPETWA